MQQSDSALPTVEHNQMLNRLANPLRWFSSTWHVQIVGSQNLSRAHSMLLVSRDQLQLMEALRGMPPLIGSGLRNCVIVGVPDGEHHRSTAVRELIEVARRENCLIIPAAAKASPILSLPPLIKNVIPLPRARIVIWVEAPFEIPEHPLEIPTAWINAVYHLLSIAVDAHRMKY
jgi:hypothetical protein